MDDEQEMIRRQMEETKASLSEKLETLEQQVVQTVQDATSAVTDTVETVKEAVEQTVDTVKGTVQDTVESVQSAFDFKRHVEERPWLMMGGAFAAGWLGGWLLGGARAAGYARRDFDVGRHGDGFTRAAAPPPPARERSYEAPSHGWTDKLAEAVGPEVGKLKGLALGAAFSLVRDAVKRSAPNELGSRVADVINDITVRLGGEPLREPLFNGSSEHGQAEKRDQGPDDLGRPETARPLGGSRRGG